MMQQGGGTATAKFNYGPFLKDLEDEWVSAFLVSSECQIVRLGRALTDDDGRVAFNIRDRQVPLGVHEIRFVVRGDRSTAVGNLFVVPPNQPAAVFDIDGTLTRTDFELLHQLIGDEAAMHLGADAVVRHHAAMGRQIIYVTGRPYPFRHATQTWLSEHDFPLGALFTTDDITQAMGAGVRRFKSELLTSLATDAGLDFEYAYGNAETDVCAYAAAAIVPDRTFVIGEHAGSSCPGYGATRPLSDYRIHLRTLRSPAPARTPASASRCSALSDAVFRGALWHLEG